MVLDEQWFTERDDKDGLALSLKIKSRLHEETTPLQRIEVYETETFGRLLVIDGYIMLSDRENFLYHEMMSHPALFTHPAPRQVMIVGGGDCGTLREVLKHAEVEHVLQVEIDERVTRVSERFFPLLCESNGDARAEFLFGDGIRHMKQAKAASLDLIIVDSTDPIGPAEGLFGREFYADCARVLRPDGLLVQQSESPLLHQSLLMDMHAAMREAGFGQTRIINFPQPVYPSGWWSATLASRAATLPQPRLGDIDTERLATRYYNARIHAAAFANGEFIEKRLRNL